MSWFRRSRIAIGTPARSFTWRGDDVVDWLSGGDGWRTTDGSFMPGPPDAFRAPEGELDAVIADDSGRTALAHRHAGTRGVVLHDGRVVRHVTRAAYHADAYDWPACFLRIGDEGRLLLAHCPESYARVELDDVETGERVSASDARPDVDFFYSRLAVSPGGKRMLTAGWVWHPWDIVQWLALAPVLADPTALDRWTSPAHAGDVNLAEESSAAWINDEILVVGAGSEPEDPQTAAETDVEHRGVPRLRPSGLAVFDAASATCVASIELGYAPGMLLPIGLHHVVTFFHHPRLVSLESGEVVQEWPDLPSGDIVSSITWGRAHPVLALDPKNARFALQTSPPPPASPAIEVVAFDVDDLPRTALEAALKRR